MFAHPPRQPDRVGLASLTTASTRSPTRRFRP